MKAFIFTTTLLAIVIGSALTARSDFKLAGAIEDQIKRIIDAVKKMIPDPLNIDHIHLQAPDDTIVSGFYNATDIQLTGVTKFNTTNLKVHILGMKMDFTFMFNHINAYFNYDSDLMLGSLVPFYGNGRVNVHINNLNVTGSGKVSLSNGLGVKNLTIYLDVDNASFDLHGLIDNEEFSTVASALMNDVVPSFIKEHQPLITKVVSPIIEDVINAAMKKKNSTIV